MTSFVQDPKPSANPSGVAGKMDRRLIVIMALVSLVCGFLGGMAAALLFTGPPENLKAKAIALIGDNGNILAELVRDAEGRPKLRLYNPGDGSVSWESPDGPEEAPPETAAAPNPPAPEPSPAAEPPPAADAPPAATPAETKALPETPPSPPAPGATTVRKPEPAKIESASPNLTVYVNKSGKRYHRENCARMGKNKIPLTLAEAKKRGYTACAICKPPP